jgi:UDP-2,3-diacylglucosamine pyrophosphatase LpxH
VAIDNVYYYVTAEQHQAVKREFEKGLPVVLMCHIPFYTPEHCLDTLKRQKGRISYMVATPAQVITDYRSNPNNPVSEAYRNKAVSPTSVSPATQEFYNWLKEQPQLKAIICGHMHEFFEEQFSPTAVQYTVGANYFGFAQEIEFI